MLFPTTFEAVSHFEEHKARILAEPMFNLTHDPSGDELNTSLEYVNNLMQDYRAVLARVSQLLCRTRKDRGILMVQTLIEKLEDIVQRRQQLTHQEERGPRTPADDGSMI